MRKKSVIDDWMQSHVALALLIGLIGIMYWFIYFDLIPKKYGYRIVQETVLQDDGVSRNVLRRIPNEVDDERLA